MPATTCIFDAYGTLFDVASAARRGATEPVAKRTQRALKQVKRQTAILSNGTPGMSQWVINAAGFCHPPAASRSIECVGHGSGCTDDPIYHLSARDYLRGHDLTSGTPLTQR